jgi:hypothetical protein
VVQVWGKVGRRAEKRLRLGSGAHSMDRGGPGLTGARGGLFGFAGKLNPKP